MFDSLADQILKVFMIATLSVGLVVGFILGAWIF